MEKCLVISTKIVYDVNLKEYMVSIFCFIFLFALFMFCVRECKGIFSLAFILVIIGANFKSGIHFFLVNLLLYHFHHSFNKCLERRQCVCLNLQRLFNATYLEKYFCHIVYFTLSVIFPCKHKIFCVYIVYRC